MAESASDKNSLIKRIKQLKTYEAIASDPQLKNIIKDVYPLTGNLGETRRLKRRLGEGTFGRVNLEETETGVVATKYFLKSTFSCDNITEIAILKYLKDYPNVAQLIKVEKKPSGLLVNTIAPSIAEDLPFPAIIMGHAGKNLYTALVEGNIRTWKEIKLACFLVISSVYVLHELGIVHRDIKPENILLTSLGEVWISDFGNSKYAGFGFKYPRSVYTGTRGYSSPELSLAKLYLLSGKNARLQINYKKSDIWALGVTLFNIITANDLEWYDPFIGKATKDKKKYYLEQLKSIFKIIGTPQEGDGITQYLFGAMYSASTPVLPRTDKITQKILYYMLPKLSTDRNKRQQEVIEINQMCEILESIFINRTNRPTAKQILNHPIFSDYRDFIPAVKERKLHEQYMVNMNNLSVPHEEIDEVINTKLMPYIYNNLPKFYSRMLSFVIDRTLIYFISFLHTFKNNEIITSESLPIILFVSLYLSYCLNDNGPSENLLFEEIQKKFEDGARPEFVEKILVMFLTSDINFFGETFFDEILKELSPMPKYDEEVNIDEDTKETIGFLNLGFFGSNILYLIANYKAQVINAIKEYITENPKDLFFSRKQMMMVNGEANEYIKQFALKKLNTDEIPILRILFKDLNDNSESAVTGVRNAGGGTRSGGRKHKKQIRKTRRKLRK